MEFWIPTRVELRELEAETNDVRRSYMERRMIPLKGSATRSLREEMKRLAKTP